MTKTGATLTGLLIISLAGLAGGTGYLTLQNIEAYERESEISLANAKKTLNRQGFDLTRQTVNTSLMGALREEVYSIRELQQGAEILAMRQTVTIEPFRAYGEFRFDEKAGMAAIVFSALPQLAQGQQGRWQFDPVSGLISSEYRSGTVNQALQDGTRVNISPLIIHTTNDTKGQRKSVTTATLSQVSVANDTLGEARVAGVAFEGKGHQRGGQAFLDRLSYRINNVKVDAPQGKLALSGFNLNSGHLVQGDVLASLMTVTFNNLKLSTQDKDLSVDPTTLRLFIDAIDWPSLEAANKKMDAVSGNEADAAALQDAVAAYAEVAARGLRVSLETLESSFILNDRGPAGMSVSGDMLINGQAVLEAGAADSLMEEWPQRLAANLRFDGSRSLMQSPFAEYFVEFIDTGYIREEGDRLVSDFKYAGGQVTANELPLDGMLATQM